MDSEARPSPQPDDSPVVIEPAPEPVFSDLISRWLDEGDRLDRGTERSDPNAPAGRAPRFERLREIVDRHRVPVLAVVGLIPMTLFLVTHRTPPPAPPQVVARSAPSIARSIAAVVPPPAPAPAVVAKPVEKPVAALSTPAPIASAPRPKVAKVKKVALTKRHAVAAAKAAAPSRRPVVANAAKAPVPVAPPPASAPKVAAGPPRPPAPVASAPKLAAPPRQPASPKAPRVSVLTRRP